MKQTIILILLTIMIIQAVPTASFNNGNQKSLKVMQKSYTLFFDNVQDVQEITLYSTSGKVIQHTSRVEKTTTLSTRGLGHGVYFYTLLSTKGVKTGSILLQ